MIIQSSNVWIAGNFMPAQIETTGKTISAIYPYGEKEVDIDYQDNWILPGFIDIHCHGAYGYDTNDAEVDGLKQWAKNIVSEGVTGFLSTTVTDSKETLLKAVKNVADVKDMHEAGKDGADILGIHFEGPYLNKEYKGAQPEQYILPASVSEFEEYQDAANGLIKVMTIAPENDKDYALTKYASQHGVVVSIGHSACTYEDAYLAIANGATSITHTFNAQTPFNHRNNGIVGAALRLRNVYSEIICDTKHSTKEALNIFFQCKGKDHGVMVSDSLLCKGGKPHEIFQFGPNTVELSDDGSAYIQGTNTLSGSTMRMCDGLKNLITKANVSLEAAINSCTLNPATLLKLDDHIGKIQSGYDCDLAILDKDYTVIQTYVKGIAQK